MSKKIILNEIGVPVVVDGEARPLMPDTFIDWLEPRLTKTVSVFEFGCGGSTLWLAPRVCYVHSVEHHILWFNALNSCKPANVDLEYIPLSRLDPAYVDAILEYETMWDIIIVDGRERDKCLKNAATRLGKTGVIVLDNSECEGFEGQAWLREQGFSEKVFSGEYAWAKDGEVHCTTVFYRPNSCLGL